jgi:hypothetical protein
MMLLYPAVKAFSLITPSWLLQVVPFPLQTPHLSAFEAKIFIEKHVEKTDLIPIFHHIPKASKLRQRKCRLKVCHIWFRQQLCQPICSRNRQNQACKSTRTYLRLHKEPTITTL